MSTRTIVYDHTFQLESYQFIGFEKPFPCHFHEHYVIGLIEGGARQLICRNREYQIFPGNLILFHPGEPHSCKPLGTEPLNYRALNLPPLLLQNAFEDLTGCCGLPYFSSNVLHSHELACGFHTLHNRLMAEDFTCTLEKEEQLFLFLTLLLRQESDLASPLPEVSDQIQSICTYLETHFAERIMLDQLCRCAGLSKSTLLRSFAQAKGMTPYRYLESVRVNHAKALLEAGITPTETALRSGFSDQSHLNGYFNRFLGLTPGTYRNIFQNSDSVPIRPLPSTIE